MWISLNCGRPVHAVWRTSGFNMWSWIWVLFNIQGLSSLAWGFRQFPTGSLLELVVVLCCVAIWLKSWFMGNLPSHKGASMRDLKWNPQKGLWQTKRSSLGQSVYVWESRLSEEFRDIVRSPLPDPSHPSFKKWNWREGAYKGSA
jgi:hypothetical protein